MGFGDLFKPKYKNSNPHVRAEAVKELTDSNILAEIVLNDPEEDVRLSAVNNPYLTNHIVLGYVIERENNYSQVKKVAQEKIDKIIDKSINQDILGDIARNNPHYSIRAKAVEKLLMKTY